MTHDYENAAVSFLIYRPREDHKRVLVCYSLEGGPEQRHLIETATLPVSAASIGQCAGKIVQQIIERSFDYAGPTGTPETVQSQQERQA